MSFRAKHKTLSNLPNNNRFYVPSTSILLSIFTASLLRLTIPSDQLFFIRLEQAYGLYALIFLYTALIISPIKQIVGRPLWMKNLEFARRGIGVSAAFFATLHTTIALWGQAGGLQGLNLLPQRFVTAFALGTIALIVLLCMAATSFDKVVTSMTPRKWKWLHRFVYLAGILIILHVWMIGTHVAYGWVQLAAFIPLTVLFALEAWCIVDKYTRKRPQHVLKRYRPVAALCLWAVLSGLVLMLPALVENYHSEHHEGQDTQSHVHEGAGHE